MRALLELDVVEMLTWNFEDTYPKFGKLERAVRDFQTYIENNRELIPNYGERYRYGERISTGFVESTINQVVAKRFSKRQQMQWTPRGAHLLLQTRIRVPNGELAPHFFCSPIRILRTRPFGILKAPHPARIVVLKLRRQRLLRKVLIANGAREALYGGRAHRCRACVGRGGIRTAVLHGRTDAHACGISVEDEPADFALQHVHEIGVGAQVLRRAVNGGRELTFQFASQLQQFGRRAGFHDERGRPKNFFLEVIVAAVGVNVGRKKGSRAFLGSCPVASSFGATDHPYPHRLGEFFDAGGVPFLDTFVEHGGSGRLAETAARLFHEASQGLATQSKDQSGIRAELAGPKRERLAKALGKGFRARFQRFGQ